MDAIKAQFKLTFNFKKCDASIVDWLTGRGEAGPGFHIYCYYERDEIEVVNPFYWDGWGQKFALWEYCYDDSWAEDVARHLLWNRDDFTWFW